MHITQDWLNDIADESGLTRGQVYLLTKWTGGTEYVGAAIPDVVANFLLSCRGYREIPQYIKDFKGWA
jgi:hypothetical protein